MVETLQSIGLALVLALVCAIGAWLLKNKKQQILATVTSLVQEAENTIQGSGMGDEKKAKVVAQLEAMGIKVNAWLSTQIDNIVAYLNTKSAWFTSNAAAEAKAAVDSTAETITNLKTT